MKFISSIFLAFFFLTTALFAQQQVDNYGKPLIVLVETNPWLMVIGSDTPSFVLYEKGRVIYKKIEGDKSKILEARLSSEESKQFLESLALSDKFYNLPDNIEAVSFTDQPSNDLYVSVEKKKKVSVYGSLAADGSARKNTPPEFLTVYDKLKKFDRASAKEWLPEKIEVMFWDYSYASKTKKWLPEFSDLNSPSTVKRSSGMYSVFIDSKDFAKFRSFYNSLEEKQAVEINGKKMAVSYRFPFPNLF
ncbi:MAG TPA: hypothetical protein VIL74_12975 [Pyrinomonadaceae bacterium]|jgi:hypothetical protein